LSKRSTGRRRIVAKIDVTQKLVGLDGEPLKDQKQEDLVLRSICENALLGMNPKEQIAGEEKMARYALAMKIHKYDEVDLSAEEITKIKKIVGDSYAPLVVGRAWEILDPKGEPEGKPEER